SQVVRGGYHDWVGPGNSDALREPAYRDAGRFKPLQLSSVCESGDDLRPMRGDTAVDNRQSSSTPPLEAAASVDIRGQRLRDEPHQKLPEHLLVREFSEGHLLPRDPRAVLRIRIGDSEGVPSRMLCDED